MKFAFSLVLCLWTALLMLGCDDSQSKKMQAVNLAAANEARLMQECTDGGAAFNAIEKRCVCETGKAWNGRACETLNPNQAQNACLSQGGKWDVGEQVCQCLSNLIWANRECMQPENAQRYNKCIKSKGTWADHSCSCPKTSTLNKDGSCSSPKVSLHAALKQACLDANGHWNNSEAYCFCTEGKTFINQDCLNNIGTITEDLCTQALSPGVWSNETCTCKDTQKIFSPSRGGCVKNSKLSETYQRRVCTSSINGGIWDTLEKRCHCPEGEFFDDELCRVKQVLSSKEVCESSYNQGRWDASEKICQCGAQRIWFNQSCVSIHKISNKYACESEANGGMWLNDSKSCDCRGRVWSATLKRCQ